MPPYDLRLLTYIVARSSIDAFLRNPRGKVVFALVRRSAGYQTVFAEEASAGFYSTDQPSSGLGDCWRGSGSCRRGPALSQCRHITSCRCNAKAGRLLPVAGSSPNTDLPVQPILQILPGEWDVNSDGILEIDFGRTDLEPITGEYNGTDFQFQPSFQIGTELYFQSLGRGQAIFRIFRPSTNISSISTRCCFSSTSVQSVTRLRSRRRCATRSKTRRRRQYRALQ
jgi:hypothetical protein